MSRRVWPFALTVLASLVILFTPESGVPSSPPGTDKLVHFVLFATLAVTGSRARVRSAWLAPGLAAYAGLSEWWQALLPLGRSGDPLDALVDVLGSTLGFAVWGLTAWLALRRRA